MAGEGTEWTPSSDARIGGVFVASRGNVVWAGAVVYAGADLVGQAVLRELSTHPYVPGLLALMQGPVLEKAVRSLSPLPDVLLVNATGRDHPRGAGLAIHLGAVLDLPTVGITDRPLVADGPEPDPERGATAPLVLNGKPVGVKLRMRAEVRPICIHDAWRTTASAVCDLILSQRTRSRTPRPMREARRLARTARANEAGR